MISLSCAFLVGSHAQATLDVPVVITGEGTERAVLDVALPEALHAGISVEAAVLGSAHWSVISVNGDTLTLTTTPAETEDRSGLLLRGTVPVLPAARLYARIDGSPARPLIHRDGTLVHGAELRYGSVVEVLTSADTHLLTSSSSSSCPPGSIPLNTTTCVDRGVSSTTHTFYQAATACSIRGGKLCTWDEYIAACNLLGASLDGLFNDWEWINDTSNHTHTVDQSGRTTCMSKRAASPNTLGATRCCYRTR